ncbi:copper homeostasis CutC domain-containing protein [Jackrogersella minutella]|nr:copper homeostasis CutC domain-containing protein [Jackrogersella minutella]
MIRPRGPLSETQARDFVYSDKEFEHMEADIRKFKESGLLNERRGDGFVFGILKEQAQAISLVGVRAGRCWVDKGRCAHLVSAARPFKTVFHRAFDEIVSGNDGEELDIDARIAWQTGLGDLFSCGFDAVLTSGGIGHAANNAPLLDMIITEAETLGIEIIVGGGVRRHNVEELSRHLRLRERNHSTFVHSACLANTGSQQVDVGEVVGILAQLR